MMNTTHIVKITPVALRGLGAFDLPASLLANGYTSAL